jgi:hypothetical protein
MANLYNLLNCSTNQPRIGYRNNGTASVGQVFNDGSGVCYRVMSVANPATGAAPAGALQLEGLVLYTNCSTCLNPQGQPSSGGGSNQGGGSGPTQTFYYRIRPCSNPNATPIPARRTSQFADLPTNGVVKGPGGQCFVVVQFDSVPVNPISQYSIDLTNQPKYQTCAECTYVPPAPWKVIYTLENCQNPLITSPAYRFPLSTETPGVSFGWTIGEVYKVDNVCWRVKSAAWQQTDGLNGFNLSNAGSTYTNCTQCNLSLSDQGLGPAGGPGSPSALVTVYYCNNGTCTPFTYEPNNNADIFPPEPNYPTPQLCQQSGCIRYTCGTNGCQPAVNGQYASLSECSSNCQTVQPPQNPWYRCTLENCDNVDEIIDAYRTTLEGLNQIYRFPNPAPSTSWKCYRQITITQENSPTAQKIGPNLDGKPSYQTCVQCLPDVFTGPTGPTDPEFPVCCFVGDTEVAMSDGSYCQIQNVAIGDEVKTSSGKTAKVIDKITPIIGERGLLSINNGKSFATPDHIFKSIDGLWLTADIELSRKSFKAFDKILHDGGIIKQLSIGDYIVTESGPVLIESFEITNSGLFDDTIVYDLKLDSDSDHTYFVDSYAAHNCDALPFCVQYPDHPNCAPPNPCTSNPCLPECPKNCAECASVDPRCNPNPPGCEAVPEPTQGDWLISWYSGYPNYQNREGYDFNWMIDPCWQHKYCVCKVQPDPNEPYAHDFVVCLCGESIEPGSNVPNPCPLAGTLIRYECRNSSYAQAVLKLEKWGIYTNGACGEYEQKIEDNSVFCGAIPAPSCTSSGTLVRTYCINLDKYAEYHDGNCGTYIERIETNSKSCGYVDPPPPPPPPPPKEVKEPTASARVYYPIRKDDTLKTIDITSFALWSNDTPFLLTPSTQSLSDSSSLSYILPVYDRSPDTKPTCSAEIQYNIIYADYEGKGARDLGGLDNQTLTKAMYTQYAHVLLPHGQQKFNFNGTDEDYVYIIDIARKRFKQSLDPGNWEMTFASTSFSLDEEKDSILSNMFTASYQGSTLTLVDTLTKRPSVVKPVYLSSNSYDVVIGTIEDGVGSSYVTSSIVSASLAVPSTDTYINTSIIANNSTVTVQGSRVYLWGLDGSVTYRIDGSSGSVVDVTPPNTLKNINPVATLVSSSYTMSLKEINTYYNVYESIYEGVWTGSFNLPIGSTLSPTKMSGSCRTSIWYNSDFQVSAAPASQQTLEGFTFAPTKDLSKVTVKQKLTVNGVTYDGNLKWRTQPLLLEYLFSGSVPYNRSVISGSYQPDVNMAFVTDAWALQDFVEDPVNPKDTSTLLDGTYFENYSDLDNGFILVPVRKTSYGRVYPSHGIIVLSGKKLDELGLNTNRSVDKNGYNAYRLFHSMKVVLDRGLTDLSGDPLAFYGRGVDIKRSARYFVTLKNSHLNYSNNPTYVTGSEGDIISSFLRQNKAYFSSIGLYNDEKELLAIGKISKPIKSSLTDEMLFTVKVTQ